MGGEIAVRTRIDYSRKQIARNIIVLDLLLMNVLFGSHVATSDKTAVYM